VSRGSELYGAQCAICHGVEGRGTRAVPQPIDDASPALVDFVIRTGRMPLPHADARIVRRDPAIDDQGRAAIVAYMRTWAAEEPEIPDPQPERGDLAHGRELYETHCIACHSPLGAGIAISQQDIAPRLTPADAVEIAQAVRTGPTVMPVFSPAVIDEDDMDSLVRYVLHLRERERMGGYHIGRSGPVSEGLVAWILGLGALLVMAYFAGERRRYDEEAAGTEPDQPGDESSRQEEP
jgi:ubiquinol-cytochrome c reductase cytochrome c subunit